MSLLTPPTPQTPAQIAQQQLQQTANQVLGVPRRMFEMWQNNMNAIWKNPNPQAVISLLGTNAAEVFAMSADFGALLEKHSPGITAPIVALVKPFTVNPDGTITINPPPA